MKQFTLFALALCVLFLPRTATSQELLENYNSGHWVLSGQSNFTYSNASGDLYEVGGNSLSVVNLNTSAGVMATRGFAVGGMLVFENTSRGSSSATVFGIGPYLQYSFLGSGPLVPSISGGFLYQSRSGSVDYTQTSILFRGSLAYMLNPNVSIGGGLQYQIESATAEGSNNSVSGSILLINVGIGIFL